MTRTLRDEFADFYERSYPEIVAQQVAISGSTASSHRAADTALAQAWDAWESLRESDDPLLRVRWSAVHVDSQESGTDARDFPDTGDPEDGIVLEALQILPAEQRQVLVLHYMAEAPVDALAELGCAAADRIDALLDEGFTLLVESLVWSEEPPAEPDDPDPDDPDPRYTWTAEALADTASRLVAAVRTPSRVN